MSTDETPGYAELGNGERFFVGDLETMGELHEAMRKHCEGDPDRGFARFVRYKGHTIMWRADGFSVIQF